VEGRQTRCELVWDIGEYVSVRYSGGWERGKSLFRNWGRGGGEQYEKSRRIGRLNSGMLRTMAERCYAPWQE